MSIDFAHYRGDVEAFCARIKQIPGYVSVECNIAPPLTSVECDEISAKWPDGVPPPLRDLWTLASRQFNCPYRWIPTEDELDDLLDIFDYATGGIWGGMDLAPAEEVYPSNPEWTDWADHFRDGHDGGRSHHLWSQCAIFYHLGNGDHLGMDPTQNPVDPPVAYLCHEDASSDYISASFTDFLTTWRELSFVEPGLLCYFLDEETKRVDPPDWVVEDLTRLLSPR